MILRSFSLGLAGTLFVAIGFLNGVSLSCLINLQAMVIVFGGMALVIALGFPRDRVEATWRSLQKILFSQRDKAGKKALLKEIFNLAHTYRIHGPLALERALSHVKHDFLRFGGMFVAEGYNQFALVHALDRELRTRAARRRSQVELLKTLMRLAPSLGMAGTVVSLMQVMGRLDGLVSAGSSLAVALSSTLYGVLVANLVLLPLAAKLEHMAREEQEMDSMVVEALLAMEKAEHPMRIAERFNAYDLYTEFREGAQVQEDSMPAEMVEA